MVGDDDALKGHKQPYPQHLTGNNGWQHSQHTQPEVLTSGVLCGIWRAIWPGCFGDPVWVLEDARAIHERRKDGYTSPVQLHFQKPTVQLQAICILLHMKGITK